MTRFTGGPEDSLLRGLLARIAAEGEAEKQPTALLSFMAQVSPPRKG